MARHFDVERMLDCWETGRDRELALRTSTGILDEVVARTWDPVSQGGFASAIEIQFEASGGDIGLALAALHASEAAHMRAAERQSPVSDRGLELWLRVPVLRARTLHRSLDGPRLALEHSYSALCWLLHQAPAGSLEGLGRMLSRPIANPLAQHAVAVLGIHAATVRRAPQLSLTGKARLVSEIRSLATACVMPAGHEPVVYPRTHALATQAFFLFNDLVSCGADEPGDVDLVVRLHDLAEVTRPDTARAGATRALFEKEWLGLLGDHGGALEMAARARADLAAFELTGHLQRAERYGYLAA
jgi:hypothetical protein